MPLSIEPYAASKPRRKHKIRIRQVRHDAECPCRGVENPVDDGDPGCVFPLEGRLGNDRDLLIQLQIRVEGDRHEGLAHHVGHHGRVHRTDEFRPLRALVADLTTVLVERDCERFLVQLNRADTGA